MSTKRKRSPPWVRPIFLGIGLLSALTWPPPTGRHIPRLGLSRFKQQRPHGGMRTRLAQYHPLH